MTTGWQVAIPLIVIVAIAGGSLIGWVALFRSASKTEGPEDLGPDPSHPGIQ